MIEATFSNSELHSSTVFATHSDSESEAEAETDSSDRLDLMLPISARRTLRVNWRALKSDTRGAARRGAHDSVDPVSGRSARSRGNSQS